MQTMRTCDIVSVAPTYGKWKNILHRRRHTPGEPTNSLLMIFIQGHDTVGRGCSSKADVKEFGNIGSAEPVEQMVDSLSRSEVS